MTGNNPNADTVTVRRIDPRTTGGREQEGRQGHHHAAERPLSRWQDADGDDDRHRRERAEGQQRRGVREGNSVVAVRRTACAAVPSCRSSRVSFLVSRASRCPRPEQRHDDTVPVELSTDRNRRPDRNAHRRASRSGIWRRAAGLDRCRGSAGDRARAARRRPAASDDARFDGQPHRRAARGGRRGRRHRSAQQHLFRHRAPSRRRRAKDSRRRQPAERRARAGAAHRRADSRGAQDSGDGSRVRIHRA